jgi:hypothetical protein
MAYNLLSGTVFANDTKIVAPPINGGKAVIEGDFHGDGANLTNVARVVANGTADYLVTIGSSYQNLVGEPNLRFNGSRLLVLGPATASALQLTSLGSGLSASPNSYLTIDSNNNLVLTSSVTAKNITNAIQFHSGSGDLTGSNNLTFQNDTLFVTGSLIVSGNIEANSFNLIATTITEISQTGSTAFGNSNDDTHHFTGSLSVYSESAEIFSIDVANSLTSIKSGLVLNRVSVTQNYNVTATDYYVGIDTATSSSIITASLPDAAVLQSGQTFVFKDEGGSADGYVIVIKPSGSQKIDNQNQVILESPHASLALYTDGASNFFIT